MKNIRQILGEPDKDYIDSRENRILLYERYGFKLNLKYLTQKKNPIIRFIPFKDRNSCMFEILN